MALLESFSLDLLVPAQEPGDARLDAMAFGPNLTITRGQAIGILTADKKAYDFDQAASDGTEKFVGFSQASFKTDANGKVYFGDTAAASYRTAGEYTAPVWKSGIFDPALLSTAAALVAQVDTFTPANVEVGDVFTLTHTAADAVVTAVSFTATATTAANVAAGLIAAWNANPVLAAVATASGTNTIVLTAKVPGTAFTVASSTTDGTGTNTQTLTRAATTAAAGRNMAHILAACPGARILHNGFILIP